MERTIDPPRAPRRPTTLRHDSHERVDEWYWLRDREDPDVLAYLEAENEFVAAGLADLEPLRDRIFNEIKSRIKETDASAPTPWGSWEYFARTIAGREYAVHCRRPRGSADLPDPEASPGSSPGEEVVLDENALAVEASYFALRGFAVSPGQALLAYSADLTGGERATLRFRNLADGTTLDDEVTDVYYGLAWANDEQTVFYVRPDDAMRPWQVWRHALGTPTDDDVLVHQEDDERFELHVGRTLTGRFVVITSGSKLTSEVRVLDADDPTASPRVIAPREQGVEYHVEHHRGSDGDRFYVLTNAGGASNFKLMLAPGDATSRDTWTEVIPHRDDVRLVDVDAFADHLVITERAEALERLRVIDLAQPADYLVEMPEEVYSAWVGGNLEFDATTFRYVYTSLVAPTTDLEHDFATRTATVIKQQTVNGYNPEEFEAHRLWATADDGTRVPISLVHRRGFPSDGGGPLNLYGYGSYEISIDPTFSVARLSLLERGVAYAIAHVRGGGELGRPWYDNGKLDHKRNTFTDFVSCAEHLVTEGYTTADQLVIRGGSAGGLLMGATANLRPDLFCAVVAEVPFVDCLTTMLDASIPLTITEWEEWGDPTTNPATYDYMLSYSPYDNVRAEQYPAILATAGLNDPRVQYWEPAKWVAKLRTVTTGDAPIYLKTELGAGHHGPSGRYEAWKDEAFVLAFVLDQLGITS
ncbi:MAG: S9 family peptidase [Acidimicrobiia bacterium]|nr:S9 family peptidase [Acidimicrobiia bacterium]